VPAAEQREPDWQAGQGRQRVDDEVAEAPHSATESPCQYGHHDGEHADGQREHERRAGRRGHPGGVSSVRQWIAVTWAVVEQARQLVSVRGT